MTTKAQGTYDLATSLSPTARLLCFDGTTKEIQPADLAAVLGVSGGGGVNAPVNTSLPVIGGTAQVGQTLNVSQGVWTQNPTSFTYQWKSNGSPVSGATQSTYVVQSTDLNHAMTCTVAATGATGMGQATTAATSNVIAAGGAIPVNTALPAISGSAIVGATLTCSQGTWNNSPSSYAYQWKSAGSPVGTNQNTYVPIGGDSGNAITCTVTATNGNGSASATSAPTAQITVVSITFDTATAPAPVTFSNNNLTAALLTGVDGDHIITATRGYNASKRYFELYLGQGWHREGGFGLALASVARTVRTGSNFNDSIAYQKDGIFINGIAILSIAPPTFTPDKTICVAADLDAKLMWCRVDGGLWNENASADPATGVGGASFAGLIGLLYPAVDLVSVNDMLTLRVDVGTTFYAIPAGFQMWGLPVGTPPTNITLPVVSGTAQVGQTLSTTNGTWNNSPSAYDYQWKVNGAPKGTNAPTYKLISGDESFTATCTVTASNTGGSNSATSLPTGTIANAPPPPNNSVAPAITGTAAEDSTLTCSTGTWSNSPTSYGYQWQINTGSWTNTGSNQNTYIPVTGDIGFPIRCLVTASNGGGSNTATSNSTSNVTSATPTAPVKTFDAVILGVPQIGIPLFVTQGCWQQRPSNKPTSFSYQWKSNGTNVGTNSNIYTPVGGGSTDLNHAITCVVSATNATGSTTSTAPAGPNVIAAIAAPAATIDFQTSPSTATLATAGITFSRSTTGTYIDASGVMQTAAINAARYDYREDGLHGLLKEPTATNYVFPSKPNTSGGRWLASGGNTITPNAVAGPDGATTASTLHLNSGLTGSGPFFIGMSTMTYPDFGSRQDWVKGTKGDQVYLFVQDATGGATYRILHTFSGAWERTGEFRFSNPNGYMGFSTVARHDLTVDSTNGLKAVTFNVAHVQIEENYIPTSAIPTTTAAVTRGEDILTVTGSTPLSAMKTPSTTANTGGGCFYIDLVTVLNGSQWDIISPGVLNGWGVSAVVEGPNTKGNIYGVQYITDAGIGLANTYVQKLMGRWQRNNYGLCVDGYGTATEAYNVAPDVSSNSWVLCQGMNGGIIRELRFWNTPINDADMVKLTALSPGRTMAAAPAGATAKGFTNLLFDIQPKKADLCTDNRNASPPAWPLFVGLYYDHPTDAPDLTDYVDSAFGLSFPNSPAISTMCPGGTDLTHNGHKGKLPFMPGKDGFSVQFEFSISNNYWANFEACWALAAEHNDGINGNSYKDDVYFWNGEGPDIERFMEFDVHEGSGVVNGGLLGSMNTIINWYSDGAGGLANDTDNNNVNWGFIDRTVPHTLEGVFDADKLECRWYIDDVLCRITVGSGYRSNVAGDTSWDGSAVPLIGRYQKFYPIFNANSADGTTYTMYVKRVRAFTKPTITDKKLVGYGDSLMYGTGSTIGNWVDLLGTDLAKPTVVKGIGGTTSDDIATRVELDVGKYDPALDIFFFDGGYNNYLNAGYVEADFARIAAAVNALGPNAKFIFVGIPTGEAVYPFAEGGFNTGDAGFLWAGRTGRARVDLINSHLSSTYGTRFFDVNAYLIANGSDGTSGDITDVSTHQIVPRSCRAAGDPVHWNNKGYTLVKNGVKARLTSLGW